MSQGIMLVTKDFDIPVINSKCTDLLQLPPNLIENKADLREAAMQEKLFELEDESCRGDGTAGNITVRDRRMRNGNVIEIRSARLREGGFVQTFTDVTERCAAEAHIARLASEDPLTGLANRRIFASALDDLFAQRQTGGSSKSQEDFAVLFLDLDRF